MTTFVNSSNAINTSRADDIFAPHLSKRLFLLVAVSVSFVRLLILSYSASIVFVVVESAKPPLLFLLIICSSCPLKDCCRDHPKHFVFKIGVVFVRKLITIFIKLNIRVIDAMKQHKATNILIDVILFSGTLPSFHNFSFHLFSETINNGINKYINSPTTEANPLLCSEPWLKYLK